MSHLSKEEIAEISLAVRSGMLSVSQELSDFFVRPTTQQYEMPANTDEMQIAFAPQRSAVENLRLRVQVTETSIILEWWAWGGMVLDRFIFSRPPARNAGTYGE